MKFNLKYKIVSLLVFTVVFSSCEDDLNVLPNDQMTEIDFLNNPENAIQLVNGVYN